MTNRKNRTLATTVDDLMSSQRLKIAIHLYEKDPNFLRSIFIELGMESQQVAKYKVITEAMKHHSLGKYNLRPYLSLINDYNKYNIYWGMSPIEQKYYMLDPKCSADVEEKERLLSKVKKQFGMD